MKTITGDYVRALWVLQFNPPCASGMICNATYAVTTQEWVEKKFAQHFRDYLFARDLLKYALQGNQCEHFAMTALLEAVNCYRSTWVPGTAPESIAACWIAFQPDNSAGGHAIIAWLIDDYWQGWEPQTQSWRALTATEALTVHHPIAL